MGVTAAVGRSWLCAETGQRKRGGKCELEPRCSLSPARVTAMRNHGGVHALTLEGPLDIITSLIPGQRPTLSHDTVSAAMSAERLQGDNTQGCRRPPGSGRGTTPHTPGRAEQAGPSAVSYSPFSQNLPSSSGFSDRTEHVFSITVNQDPWEVLNASGRRKLL